MDPRPGVLGRRDAACYDGEGTLTCLSSPRCSPPAWKIRVGSRTRAHATAPSPRSTASAPTSKSARIAPCMPSAGFAAASTESVSDAAQQSHHDPLWDRDGNVASLGEGLRARALRPPVLLVHPRG